VEIPDYNRIFRISNYTRLDESIVEVEIIKEVIVEVPAQVKSNDLIIQGTTARVDEAFGWFVILGEVLNNGTGIAEFVEITATFYSVAGDVICTGFDFTSPTELGPGQSAPFEIICFSEDVVPRIDSWKLVVSSS